MIPGFCPLVNLKPTKLLREKDNHETNHVLSKRENDHETNPRASSSYFFLFFPIFLSILLFFLFFSNFLLFFLFFSHFTYNKQIFVRDLNILSLFKYVVYRVH